MANTSIEAVKAEGNFYKEQFDATTEDDLDALLQARIDEAEAEIRRQVGDATYETSDEVLAQILATGETYLATAKAFQTVHNIVATWDREALPTEFIDREALPGIIERYRRLAADLLRPLDIRADESSRPYFNAL